MSYIFLIITLFLPTLACSGSNPEPLFISNESAQKIAEKIWHNECRGTIEGLTSWNVGEEFASLGIGHFIWYPHGHQGRFKETFPELMAFLDQKGASIPFWIKSAKGCPWISKEEFESQKNSNQMQQLRQFLFDTRSLQAEFIALRLEKCLPKLSDRMSPSEKSHLETQFHRLSQSPEGMYALIDYVISKAKD